MINAVFLKVPTNTVVENCVQLLFCMIVFKYYDKKIKF